MSDPTKPRGFTAKNEQARQEIRDLVSRRAVSIGLAAFALVIIAAAVFTNIR